MSQATDELNELRAGVQAARGEVLLLKAAFDRVSASGEHNAAVVEAVGEALKDARGEVSLLEQELADYEKTATAAYRASDEFAEKIEKVKEVSAKGISDELPEKLKDIRAGFTLAGDASLPAGRRMQAFAGAVGIAARTATNLAGQLWAAGRAASQAEGQYEDHNRSVEQLGSTYGRIQQATAGVITAEQALHAQRELATRGVQLQGDALVTVTRALREYARDHQSTAEEALGAFSSAVDGDAAALARFGVQAGNAGTASQRFARIQQQLAAQQAGQSVAGRNGAENEGARAASLERLGQNYSRVFLQHIIVPVNFLADTVAPKVEGALTGAYNAVNRFFRPEAVAAQTAELQRNAQVQAQRGQAEEQAQRRLAAAREADARAEQEAAQTELGVLAQELRAQGEVVDATIEGVSAREAYTRAVLASQTAAQREGETDAAFAQRRGQLLSQQQSARERALAVEQRARQEARSADELGVLVSSLRHMGVKLNSQMRSVSVQQQYNHLLREANTLQRSELENAEQFEQRRAQTLQQLAAARQTLDQQAAEAAARRVALREAREALGLVAAQAGLRLLTSGQQSAYAPGLSALDHAQHVTNEQRLIRLQNDAIDATIRRADGERTLTDVMRRRAAAGAELVRVTDELAQKQEQLAVSARLAQIALDDKRGNEELLAATERKARVDAAQGQSWEQFDTLRAGLGRATVNAELARQQTRDLQSGRLAEADLLKSVTDLEREANAALGDGTRLGAQRAAQLYEQAQATMGVVNANRELAASLRESNNASAQFATAFAGSEEAAHGAGFTMADLAKTSKGAFDVMGGAASSAFTAYIEGSASAEEALSQFGRNALKGLAEYFIGQAVAYTATGLGMLAVQNYPGAGLAFAAAGGFGAAAALAGGVYMATAPTKPADASTASTAGTGSQARGSENGAGAGGGSVTYEFNFNGLLSTRDAAAEIARVQDAGSRMGIRPNFAERS